MMHGIISHKDAFKTVWNMQQYQCDYKEEAVNEYSTPIVGEIKKSAKSLSWFVYSDMRNGNLRQIMFLTQLYKIKMNQKQ